MADHTRPFVKAENLVWDTGLLEYVPQTASSGGGDGAILDGVSASIKATVKDYVNSNPLTVITVDTNGDPTSAGGTTQYTEDTASTAGESVIMVGVVRNDVRGTLVNTDGDRAELQVNASGDLRVDGSAVTQPISAASLPLPAGAATATRQDTGNTSLASIDTKLTNPLPVSLPAGFATSAKQDTGNTSLGAIDGHLDVALSTRLKPADTLTGVTTVGSVTTITNPVSTKTDLTPSAPTVATVGIASAQAVAAAATRKGLTLRNLSTSGQRISLGFGSAAVLDSGNTLYAQDTFRMDEYDFDLGAVNAIASAVGASLAIQEYLA